MGFEFTERAASLAAAAGGRVRVEIRPGPQYAKPLLLDVFFEEAPPRDHVSVVSGRVAVCVPSHLTWLADNDVRIDAAQDGHLFGTIEDVRRPW